VQIGVLGKRRKLVLLVKGPTMKFPLFLALLLLGCGSDTAPGAQKSCSVEDGMDGTFTMTCPDGSEVTWSERSDVTIPPGANGMDGGDGSDGDRGPEGPAGRDGQDGEDGAEGPPGRDGRDGADGARGPAGVDGRPGTDGTDGANGQSGAEGAQGRQGDGGEDAEPCTVEDNGDDSFTMTCPDGTSVTWTPEGGGGGQGVFVECDPNHTILQGSFVIQNEIDLAHASCFTEFTGTLTVDASHLRAVHLPNLVRVGAALNIRGGLLEELGMPALTQVGDRLNINNIPRMQELTFPALRDVGENVSILGQGNTILGTIHLPLLETVGGSRLQINTWDLLFSLNLDSLTGQGNPDFVPEVQIMNNSTLCQSFANAVVARLRVSGWNGRATVAGNNNGC
jgi:hypothetical protein